MQSRSIYVRAFLAISAVTVAVRADVPPPNACTTPGQPCAIPDAGIPAGVCRESTCTRVVPNPDGGAPIPMTYPCNLCMSPVDDGGTDAESGGEAGGGGAGGSAGNGGAAGAGGAAGTGTGTGGGGAGGLSDAAAGSAGASDSAGNGGAAGAGGAAGTGTGGGGAGGLSDAAAGSAGASDTGGSGCSGCVVGRTKSGRPVAHVLGLGVVLAFLLARRGRIAESSRHGRRQSR